MKKKKEKRKTTTLNVLAPVQRPGFVYNRCLTENQAACCAPHVCEQVFHKFCAIAVVSLSSVHNETSNKPKLLCCTTNGLQNTH